MYVPKQKKESLFFRFVYKQMPKVYLEKKEYNHSWCQFPGRINWRHSKCYISWWWRNEKWKCENSLTGFSGSNRHISFLLRIFLPISRFFPLQEDLRMIFILISNSEDYLIYFFSRKQSEILEDLFQDSIRHYSAWLRYTELTNWQCFHD